MYLVRPIIFLFIFVTNIHAQKVEVPTFKSFEPVQYRVKKPNFLSVELNTYKSKKKIDKCFKKFIKKKYGERFSIVNEGETYNNTDVIFYRYKPFRSLFFTSYEITKEIGIIYYVNGIKGKPYICLLYKKNEKLDYEIYVLGVSTQIETLEDLKKHLRAKEYSVLENTSF
jgi:hypothetical protein